MLYPEKIKAKKSNQMIKIVMLLSIAIAFLLVIMNKMTTPTIPWAALANAGILYSWVVVVYALKRNVNIAGHVLLQLITLSLLLIYIDYKLGNTGWSINIAIPIVIMIANVIMLVLTLVSYQKYMKYAIFQLIIVISSMIPLILITEQVVQNKILSVIASGVSILNFMIGLGFSARELKETVIRKFHI